MLRASGRRGEITLAAEDGRIVSVLNGGLFAFTVGERAYQIARKGLFSPTYELRREDSLLASAAQAAFVNRYAVECAGKAWTLKAAGLAARKFALLDGKIAVGAIAPTSLNPYRETIVDLPEAIPVEAQIFLTWIVARHWDQD
ncbi:MAG TPA: hypothetical protein VKU03_03890 [Roseiarcus sp.]|nr:hypothetical protein [Roseiarcus sp.]